MHGVTAQRLRCPLPARFTAQLPAGVDVAPYRSEFARDVHGLLEAAYRDGAGEVAPFALWQREFEHDQEFEAHSCFLAFRDERLVGVALCWSSGFVKDLAVDEAERSAGLGTFLLRRVCDHFGQRGTAAVDLKVKIHNGRALRLYLRLGFERVSPIGQFE